MPDPRINCWTAAYEADTLQIELVVNCLANMIGLLVSGEMGEHPVLVNCLIKPDLGIKSKLPVSSSTKYKSVIKIKIPIFS